MLQLTIKNCSHDETEMLGLFLEELGAVSLTLTDQHDNPILEPLPGETPLWPTVALEALYLEKEEANNAIKALAKHYPLLNPELNPLLEADWERVCLKDFVPQQFGKRLWVCPSWLTPPDPAAINLILDPGLAFGTGTHPTTALCLTWLEQAPLIDQTLIDYGCGSGILAVAALKLGAQHVYAVDIDEQAILATTNNALTNAISIQQMSVSQPENLEACANYLVANILLAPLLQLKMRFYNLLQTNGTLVISGLLATQRHELIATYQPEFDQIETKISGDWVLVVLKRVG